MIVCVCQNVSDKKVKNIIEEYNILNIKELQKKIAICDQCRICSCELKDMISKYQNTQISKFR